METDGTEKRMMIKDLNVDRFKDSPRNSHGNETVYLFSETDVSMVQLSGDRWNGERTQVALKPGDVDGLTSWMYLSCSVI